MRSARPRISRRFLSSPFFGSHTDLANLTDGASLRPRLSALPPTRMSVGCDERNFSSSEECSLLLNSAGWYTREKRCVLREIREICVKKIMRLYFDASTQSIEEVKWYLPPIPRNGGVGGYVAM